MSKRQKIASDERDGFLYDFGVNSAGTVKLRISGERGRQIDLQFGEYFAPDGEPDTSNICFYPAGYSQRDVYILKGEGEEVLSPCSLITASDTAWCSV